MRSSILYISTIITSITTISSCNEGKENKAKNEIDKPNIILFVTDDHGNDALGCYGNPIIKTPNLDKLANEGVMFNNAYCTSASSAASRSTLLTGKFNHAIGAYGHVHDYHHFRTYDTIRSLPVMMHEDGGYYTARIGKYHVAPEKVYHFEKVFEANPRNTVEMAHKVNEVFNSEQPFFLYFCPDDPHRSDFTNKVNDWRAPNRFGNRDEGFTGVETIAYNPNNVIVPYFLPDNNETRRELAEYYQSISRIDQGLGVLMKLLEESGKAENTIIIYISDNGMAFPGAKTTTYEPGIKLPCIIRDPSVHNRGITNNAMISWVDLAPTILDMAGIEQSNESFHGRSFKKIIGEENPEGWNTIQASHTFHEITMYYPMRVFREDNFKLIWNIAYPLEYPFASDLWISSTWQNIIRNETKMYGKQTVESFLHRAEFELFDLQKDPYESHNLATENSYQEKLKEMKENLKNWQYRTSDPWVIMWNHDTSLQGVGEKL